LSSSLIPFNNALPDPQQQIESLQRELYQRNRQLAESEEALRQERQKNAGVEVGIGELRTMLSPLYQGLQRIFGEIDALGIEGPVNGAGLDPRKAAVWEDWKRKMPGLPAKFIEALMLHGELTQTQLRLHAKCAAGSVAGVVSQLWKAGLINKNGGKISLKEL
jgi:hypothetical protein